MGIRCGLVLHHDPFFSIYGTCNGSIGDTRHMVGTFRTSICAQRDVESGIFPLAFHQRCTRYSCLANFGNYTINETFASARPFQFPFHPPLFSVAFRSLFIERLRCFLNGANESSSYKHLVSFFSNFVPLETLNTQDIESLVIRLKSGDQTAFSEVYDRYSAALNGIVLRIITDQDAAQDVLQDTFVKIWKNIQQYDSTKGSFFTWMLNIARNTSIDSFRKLKKEVKSEIQNTEKSVSVLGTIEQSTNTIGLDKLVEKLSPEQQLMIKYVYFKGYTHQEVSDELDLPLGTVKTRTRLAMRELRKWFTLLVLWM